MNTLYKCDRYKSHKRREHSPIHPKEDPSFYVRRGVKLNDIRMKPASFLHAYKCLQIYIDMIPARFVRNLRIHNEFSDLQTIVICRNLRIYRHPRIYATHAQRSANRYEILAFGFLFPPWASYQTFGVKFRLVDWSIVLTKHPAAWHYTSSIDVLAAFTCLLL